MKIEINFDGNEFRIDRIKSISFPKGITSIGDDAFYRCESLTSLVIPESVTSIGFNAFSGCESLTDIYYSGTQEQWNNIEGITYAGFKGSETIHFNS